MGLNEGEMREYEWKKNGEKDVNLNLIVGSLLKKINDVTGLPGKSIMAGSDKGGMHRNMCTLFIVNSKSWKVGASQVSRRSPK